MDKAIVVYTTLPEENTAQALGKRLLEAKLAACIQTSSCNSSYWWQGKIHEAPEWQLAIKTVASHYPKIEALIKEHHPDDLPQIYALKCKKISSDYLNWLQQS